MRTRQLVGVVALTCAASMAILAAGGWPGGDTLPAGGHPAAPVRARGHLVGVDLARGTVTLAMEARSVTLKIDRGTAVFVRGRFGSLAELPLGAPVCAAVNGTARSTVEWLEPC